jgi:hypothetical protein
VRVKLSLVEKSEYYKALLVLSGRDRIIDRRERELMLHIGKVLDFEKRFCEAALDDLKVNAHITREPVVFADPIIADCFFRDAIRLALVDGELNPLELRWLRRMAHANGRTDPWLDALILDFQARQGAIDHSTPLEIQQHL